MSRNPLSSADLIRSGSDLRSSTSDVEPVPPQLAEVGPGGVDGGRQPVVDTCGLPPAAAGGYGPAGRCSHSPRRTDPARPTSAGGAGPGPAPASAPARVGPGPCLQDVSRHRRDRQVVEEDLRRSGSTHQVHHDPLEVCPFQAHRTPRRGPQHPGLPLDRRAAGWRARAVASGPPGRRSSPGSGRTKGPWSPDRCPPASTTRP